VAGAVVHDPVDRAGRPVGLNLHDLVHEPAEGEDPARDRPYQRTQDPRGKIQERVCHGLIASSCSQRQIVEADTS